MLIMMDGVEMNDPSNYISVSNVPLEAVERIEIVKTPASVLYGPAAVGGVINIITKSRAKLCRRTHPWATAPLTARRSRLICPVYWITASVTA
ncbi:MAG: TonB-dependent receptor plug domain-containing protein [Candidatus Electrothrix gigas]